MAMIFAGHADHGIPLMCGRVFSGIALRIGTALTTTTAQKQTHESDYEAHTRVGTMPLVTRIESGLVGIASVSAGWRHAFAVLRDGSVCYIDDKGAGVTLLQVEALAARRERIASIAVGVNFLLARNENGTVYHLSPGDLPSNSGAIPPPHQWTAQCIAKNVSQVACGYEHALLLSSNGTVWSYGANRHGQLGHGDIDGRSRPEVVEALDGVRGRIVRCGGWHSAVVSGDGDVYLFGWNKNGQLGLASDPSQLASSEPSVVPLPTPLEVDVLCNDGDEEADHVIVADVECGSHHTVLQTGGVSGQRVFVCGLGERGQLAIGHPTQSVYRPVEITDRLFPERLRGLPIRRDELSDGRLRVSLACNGAVWNSYFLCHSSQ
eukprot:Opistho-2@15156